MSKRFTKALTAALKGRAPHLGLYIAMASLAFLDEAGELVCIKSQTALGEIVGIKGTRNIRRLEQELEEYGWITLRRLDNGRRCGVTINKSPLDRWILG